MLASLQRVRIYTMATMIVFFISFLALVFMLYNKHNELVKGKGIVKISIASDEDIRQRIETIQLNIKEFPRKVIHLTAFFTVKHGLNIFDKVRQIVYPKISHIIDAVKGKDVPKNKGSVSLFLKHIEEHRRSTQ